MAGHLNLVQAHTSDQIVQINRLDLFMLSDALREIEGRIDHPLQGRARVFVVHHFGPHPKRRQRRAQIMRKRCKHLGPVTDKSRQAILHDVE